MKTTNKFARLISTIEIEFAPTLVVLDGQTIAISPESPDAAEIYARCSPPYLPYRDEPPTVEPPSYARPTGYEERDGIARRVYEQVPLPPPPPRVFSKLKVVAALTEAGVWPQVKAWIESKGLYDLYLAAQEFAEDNEYFAQGLAALKPVVGWTDERVEALLAKCVKE